MSPIVLVVRRFERRGGSERLAIAFATGLARDGREVHVVTAAADPAVVVPGIRVHRVAAPRLGRVAEHLAFAAASRARVAALRGLGVGPVVAFDGGLQQDLLRLGGGTHLGALAAGERRRPLTDRTLVALERLRFDPARTRRFVVPSARVGAELIRHYGVDPRRIERIPNGVDLDRFRPRTPAERRERRRALGLDPRRPLALFVGREATRKRLDLAARVAEASGFALLVIGPRRPSFGLRGSLGPREDVERWLAVADHLLVPSVYEPFGQVVLEAAAAGVVPWVSGEVGAAEVLTEGGLGRLVLPRGAGWEGWVAALAAGAPAREELGAAARRLAERYDLATWRRHLAEAAERASSA